MFHIFLHGLAVLLKKNSSGKEAVLLPLVTDSSAYPPMNGQDFRFEPPVEKGVLNVEDLPKD